MRKLCVCVHNVNRALYMLNTCKVERRARDGEEEREKERMCACVCVRASERPSERSEEPRERGHATP